MTDAATVDWRDTLAWAAVGTLGYLVLLQGYELWSGVRVDLLVKAGTTLVVAVLALVATTVVARRLHPDA
jgi:hypothetical protein